MKKRFKTTQNNSLLKKALLLIISVILVSFFSTKFMNSLFKSDLFTKSVIKYIINPDNEFKPNKIFSISNSIFKYSKKADDDQIDIKDANAMGDYLEDPEPNPIKNPIVYIYNTHQTEEYGKDYLEPYNIKPTVMLASYMLREKLNDLGIETIVETNEVKKVLNDRGWKYGHSYLVTRSFMESAKKNNESLKIFIDLHRDSSIYKKTTITIDNKKYARILFVVGLEHDNYAVNLDNANKLNEIIKNYNPSLSRGIMKKSGKGVNGKYNQDFSFNTFLIELGGQYNNISEVKNTINILADSIYDYIGGLE